MAFETMAAAVQAKIPLKMAGSRDIEATATMTLDEEESGFFIDAAAEICFGCHGLRQWFGRATACGYSTVGPGARSTVSESRIAA
jgi:hypothetical protein